MMLALILGCLGVGSFLGGVVIQALRIWQFHRIRNTRRGQFKQAVLRG